MVRFLKVPQILHKLLRKNAEPIFRHEKKRGRIATTAIKNSTLRNISAHYAVIFGIFFGKNKNHENLEFSRNLVRFKYDFKTTLASFVRIEVVNNKSIVVQDTIQFVICSLATIKA